MQSRGYRVDSPRRTPPTSRRSRLLPNEPSGARRHSPKLDEGRRVPLCSFDYTGLVRTNAETVDQRSSREQPDDGWLNNASDRLKVAAPWRLGFVR